MDELKQLVPVIVSWLDTNASHEEYKRGEDKAYPIHTIGFLMDEDDGHYTVCWDYCPKEKLFQGTQHIPKGMVFGITKLAMIEHVSM